MKHTLCLAVVLLLFLGYAQAAEVPFVELKGHTAWVNFAVYTSDGKKIITASMDDTARIWDAESGEELKKMEMRDRSLRSRAFSPDKKKMVVTGGRVVRILDVESGEVLQTLRHTNSAMGATFSPDGRRIVTTIWNSPAPMTARIWDAESGRELHTLEVPDSSTFHGVFSPDGKKLVLRIADNTARIWDTESGKELHTLTGHPEVIDTVSFSPDGTKVVTVSRRSVHIWDVESGRELHRFTEQLGGVRDAAFSPDGRKVVTTSGSTAQGRGSFARNSDTRIWDVETGKELRTLEGAESFIVFSPDGKKIVTGGKGHTAVVWDAESGRELHRLQGNPNSRANVGLYVITLMSYDPKVSSVTFSPDGKKVVTTSNDGSVRIWSLE
jgi:WD40 repeat protein